MARPILFTFCNVLLFGVVLWGSDADKSSYSHVALESILQSELPSRRLNSTPQTSSTPISTSETNIEVSSTNAESKQQDPVKEQPPVKSEEATLSPNNLTKKQVEKVSPIQCDQQLANRKSDEADPNQKLDESPYKHINLTNPNMYISLHDAKFDPMRWNAIYNNGNYYETGITEQFRSILQNTTKPGLVIDVGMNIGWFSIYSRAMGHKVAGFDPNPIMHTRLCESLQLNGWLDDNTVKSFSYGLGAEPAVLKFTTGNNPGKASFFEDRMAKRFRKQSQVSVVKLDDVADQQGWLADSDTPIYLWKMDVEGYEYHVLEGAQKLLQSGRVQNIIMENSNKDIEQVAKMYTNIYNAGYEIKMLSNTNGGPVRQSTIDPLNKIFAEAKGAKSLLENQEIAYFTRLTLNIWWIRRDENEVKGIS